MSALFTKAKEQLGKQGIHLENDDIRVMLVASSYTFDAADEFLSDLGAVDNGRSAALSGKSFTNAIFDATDSTLNATAAVACNALIFFKHTGNDATARVIYYCDSGVGIPFTPEAGQACPLVFDNGASKIFAL